MSSGLLIKEMAAHERPRERLMEHGADKLKDEELIAIMLRTGMKGISAISVAQQLLKLFDNSLENLARADLDELRKIKGVGRDKAIALKAAFTLAQRMAAQLRRESPVLDNPEAVVRLIREDNRLRSTETLQVLMLNTRRRLIRIHEVADGTLDSLLVHPREVFRAAIAANASAILLVHNHPSGDPTPSEADIKVTRDLIRSGNLLKIDVIDHIIIGHATSERQKDYSSLKELGYFA
jgi:DNA repair protein RadC